MKQKSENQKALPKFLGILVIASLVGGVLGGLSGAAGYFLKGEELGAAITRLLSTASPWAMALLWGDRIFEKCGIRRDEGGDGGKTLEIRGKRRLSARDGGANYQQS